MRGTKTVVVSGLFVTKAVMSLWEILSTKTNRVGLSGNVTILGLSVTEAKVFLWYDVRSKTKRWWHGYISKESPLAMGMGVGAVGSE